MENNQENNDIRIDIGLNLSSDIKVAIEELRNMSNEQVDTLMSNINPPLSTNFNPLAKLSNEVQEEPFELTESDFDDEIYKNRTMYFLDMIVETLNTNNIITIEEKQIPTEREFKKEAKKLKVSGNFSSLGAAQNELARRYGFKEYRAIKNSFNKQNSIIKDETINIIRHAITQINKQKNNNFEVAVNKLHELLKEYETLKIESNLFENIDNINKKIYININSTTVVEVLGYFDIGRDCFLFHNKIYNKVDSFI